MEPVAIGDLRSEYYDANSDFPGLWELDENRREDVDFRNSSSIRIWYNDLTSNFATHWHNALEIIIPIDNYYDVEVEGISYHLRPDEILIIPPGKLHHLTAPSSGSRFIYLLDYIDKHYAEELNLEEIADSSGFSKYHFSRLFKQYTGFTFCDYLCYRRIKAAELLLSRQDLSITEVALQSGFSSISTFNRIFKQQKKCTPSEYRSKVNV